MSHINAASIAIGIVGGLILAIIIYVIQRNSAFKLIAHSKTIAKEITAEAKKEAENARKTAMLEAKDEMFKQKSNFEKEFKERQNELRAQEKKYNERLSSLDKRLETLDKRKLHLLIKIGCLKIVKKKFIRS